MVILDNLKQIPHLNSAVIAIGMFDGLHCGHLAVIDELKKKCKENGSKSVILTFKEHPPKCIYIGPFGNRLSLFSFNLFFFKQLQVDYVIVPKFDHKFADIERIDFLNLLKNRIHDFSFVGGHDFSFGRKEKGHSCFSHLDYYQMKNVIDSFKFHLVPSVCVSGKQISSTKIRQFLNQGDIEQVSCYLGYPYFLEGPCVHGDGLGKTLGYATVNIALDEVMTPKDGVYQSVVQVGNELHLSMSFVGFKNFGQQQRKQRILESHIFGFDANLYNQWVRIFLGKRIRSSYVFDSLDQLKTQLQKDEKQVKYDEKSMSIERIKQELKTNFAFNYFCIEPY